MIPASIPSAHVCGLTPQVPVSVPGPAWQMRRSAIGETGQRPEAMRHTHCEELASLGGS
jgi:hypothetical protein